MHSTPSITGRAHSLVTHSAHEVFLVGAASHSYTPAVAETAAARFDSRIRLGGLPPLRGFFTSVRLALLWSGLGGGALALAGFLIAGLSTLPCARPPRLTAGSRVLQLD